jgi:hypothetical protein
MAESVRQEARCAGAMILLLGGARDYRTRSHKSASFRRDKADCRETPARH